MRALVQPLVAASLSLVFARAAVAQPAQKADRYSFFMHGETHAELYRRALLPGSYGAVAVYDTALPVYQYVLLGARDQAIARSQAGLDLELAAWSRAELGSTTADAPLDGDIQTANVGYHRGPIVLRVGRQHVAGGAARYARFDGVLLDAQLGDAFEGRAYAGLTVLPRWNQSPSYTYLGAAVDSDLKSPTLSAGTRERRDYWLSGARLGWASRHVRAGLSFHEQHESGGLSRRTLTLDESMELSGTISAGASASAELEAERIAEARIWVDAAVTHELDWSFEWLHTEPALFLSRQSVLSVFSADNYDEGGTRVALRASERISLDGGAWLELYSGSRPGARSELALRVIADRAASTFVRLTYTRVSTPDNGYHSLRSSLTRRIMARLSGTLEAYAYLYDRAIRSYRTSSVYSGTLEFRPVSAVGLLWGASLVRSPYATLDAQTQVRVAYDFDFSTVRGVP